MPLVRLNRRDFEDHLLSTAGFESMVYLSWLEGSAFAAASFLRDETSPTGIKQFSGSFPFLQNQGGY